MKNYLQCSEHAETDKVEKVALEEGEGIDNPTQVYKLWDAGLDFITYIIGSNVTTMDAWLQRDYLDGYLLTFTTQPKPAPQPQS